jgi:general secretion pathway protein C
MVDMQTMVVRLPLITELAIVVLAAWLIAGWLLPLDDKANNSELTMTEKKTTSLDMKLQLDTPLFGDAKKKEKSPEPVQKVVAPSRLNIKLIGTVVADERSAAVVVMQGAKEQQLFFIGDVMRPGIILQAVEVDAIVVDNQKRLERIELEKGGKSIVAPTPSNRATPAHQQRRDVSRRVSRNMLDRQMQNFPQLLSQARVVPHFENGKSDGFLISAIVSGSLYEKVGLQNGDIIRKVNGAEVTGPQQAMAMFQNLQNAASIDVEIQRAGNVQQVHYDIQ